MAKDPEKTVEEIEKEAAVEYIPLYLQRKDCTEEQVNALIQLGYVPQWITPTVEYTFKDGRYQYTESHIIYHFIRKTKKEV